MNSFKKISLVLAACVVLIVFAFVAQESLAPKDEPTGGCLPLDQSCCSNGDCDERNFCSENSGEIPVFKGCTDDCRAVFDCVSEAHSGMSCSPSLSPDKTSCNCWSGGGASAGAGPCPQRHVDGRDEYAPECCACLNPPLPRVRLSLSKNVYAVGEKVKATVKSEENFEVNGGGFWVQRFYDGAWIQMRSVSCPCGAICAVAPVMPLKAGEERNFEWDQIESWCTDAAWSESKTVSQPVPAGRYRVASKIGVGENYCGGTLYAEFTIKP